jgi:tetraspanin-18
MKCCGVDSYEDFKASKKWNEGDKIIPKACCVLKGDIPRFQPKDKDCPYKPSDTNSYWKTVCSGHIIFYINC